jgi:glycosyltransferase involved in cell wall biosynthesis
MNDRITIHICSRDRATEISLLLQSLRTQLYQDFDIIILDDASGTPLTNFSFFVALINRIKLEGHKVKLLRNEISTGVCGARNKLIDEDDFDNKYVLRLDDDCIPEYDYIYDLHDLLCSKEDKGCGMVTGVIPLLIYPEIVRSTDNVKDEVICRHTFDNQGNLTERKDELSYCYEEGIPYKKCHQFRTNVLYLKEITDKGVRYPSNLSRVGFREELWFSFQAQILGYQIWADLNAVAYHLQTPSGGTRCQEYSENVKLDEETTDKQIKVWYEKHGDFLK